MNDNLRHNLFDSFLVKHSSNNESKGRYEIEFHAYIADLSHPMQLLNNPSTHKHCGRVRRNKYLDWR